MAIVPTVLGTAQNKAAATSWTPFTSITLAAGEHLFFKCAYDYTTTVPTATWNSLSMQKDVQINNADGVCTVLFSYYSAAGGTGGVVVSWGATSITAKAASVAKASGVATSNWFVQSQILIGSDVNPTSGNLNSAPTTGNLVTGVIGIEGPDNDAAGTWFVPETWVDADKQRLGTTGAGAASNITINSNRHLVAASKPRYAYIGSITSRDWAGLIAEYAAAADTGIAVTAAGTGALAVVSITVISGIAVNLAGTGAIATTTKHISPASASLSGAGSLSASIALLQLAAANLSGGGSLSATLLAASFVPIGATAAGTGALSAGILILNPISASISGTGTLSATFGAQIVPMAASISGSGALASQMAIITGVAANLSGAGTLTVVLIPLIPVSASFAGSGQLSGSLTTFMGIGASLSGTGTLAAQLGILSEIAANLSGAGSLGGGVNVLTAILATLSGAGSLAVDILVVVPISASVSGTGSLSAAVTVLPSGSIGANLVGTGALAADLGLILPFAASLAGLGALAAGISLLTGVAAALSGIGALAADIMSLTDIAASLAGSGSLSASVTVISGGVVQQIAASLSGAGSLTASVTVIPVSVPAGGAAPSLARYLRRRMALEVAGEIVIWLLISARSLRMVALVPAGAQGFRLLLRFSIRLDGKRALPQPEAVKALSSPSGSIAYDWRYASLGLENMRRQMETRVERARRQIEEELFALLVR